MSLHRPVCRYARLPVSSVWGPPRQGPILELGFEIVEAGEFLGTGHEHDVVNKPSRCGAETVREKIKLDAHPLARILGKRQRDMRPVALSVELVGNGFGLSTGRFNPHLAVVAPFEDIAAW